ncbi:hypothetical protein JOM56_008250 [Amanita muscaria]
MTRTTPNESPQLDNGVKPPSRRRPPYPLKNSSAQASKHVSENKSRHNHSKLPPSPKTNDVPPSQSNTNSVPTASNSSSDVKSNIDALVERVRASAMANNRPNTPGSHIDWAGDDDNSLPDLDDWGISPPTLPTGHTMISPIIVDGLTPLPDPATTLENQGEPLVKASITKPDTPHSLVDNIPTRDVGKGLDQLKSSDTVENSVAQAESLVRDSPAPTSLHLSLQPKPTPSARNSRKHGDGNHPNAKKKDSRTRDSRANDETKASTTPRSQPRPLQGNDSKHKDSGEAEKGLAASIHAPERQTASKLSEPKSEKPPILERHSPSKGTIPAKNIQPFTDGQPPSPRRPINGPPYSSRQSKHNRPVLTGAAISKIAKTIGGPAARSPLSTSTE